MAQSTLPIATTTVPDHRLLLAYYGATVAFIVLDYAAGLNLRLTFLDGMPIWRALYYLVCLLCLVVIWRFPDWSAVVAVAESTVALSALIIETGIRVLTITEIALEGGEPITVREIVNFLLAGGAAYVGLKLRSRRARRELESRFR